MDDNQLPSPGDRVRCVTNRDRPELTVGQVYTVKHEPFLDKMPMNPKRWYPDDYRFIAVEVPGDKEPRIVPFGCFEVVSTKTRPGSSA
jgi:hypothetical protein